MKSCPITFGKYKGCDLNKLLFEDYKYIGWVVKNVELKDQKLIDWFKDNEVIIRELNSDKLTLTRANELREGFLWKQFCTMEDV